MFNYMISFVLLLTSLVSFAGDFVVGQDYEVIKSDNTTQHNKHAIDVTEFFSFACPWCYKVETGVNNWILQQGSAISFQKVPVIFNKDWEYYAKAYYTLHALSLNAMLNPVLFKAIVDEKQPLNSNEAMIAFLTKNGVDATTAKSAFTHSPSIELDIATSQRLMGEYHINAVPAFVINHQFKTDLQMAKTEQRLFEILNFLVKKAADKTATK